MLSIPRADHITRRRATISRTPREVRTQRTGGALAIPTL